jgi:hypothetical protein
MIDTSGEAKVAHERKVKSGRQQSQSNGFTLVD